MHPVRLIIFVLLIFPLIGFGQERSFNFSNYIVQIYYRITLIGDTQFCSNNHIPPKYELGIKQLAKHLYLKYPREYVDGKLITPEINGEFKGTFTISSDGHPENIIIEESPHQNLDKDFIERCKKTLKLTPAMFEDKYLATKITYIATYKSK